MLKEEKHIRLNYAKQSIKKILSLIERLQGIKSNCVEMASSKYNINSEEFFDKVFSTTQMPLIKNSQTIIIILYLSKQRETKIIIKVNYLHKKILILKKI